jgi:hypothetical protein
MTEKSLQLFGADEISAIRSAIKLELVKAWSAASIAVIGEYADGNSEIIWHGVDMLPEAALWFSAIACGEAAESMRLGPSWPAWSSLRPCTKGDYLRHACWRASARAITGKTLTERFSVLPKSQTILPNCRR